jgi:hypothetical protein
MARKHEPIPDHLLLANGVWDLDPTLRLSPRQVSMLTALSEGQLKERRRTRPPQPPRTIERKKGTGVWYPLGEVLAHKANSLARPLPRIKQQTGITTFAKLLERGGPDDAWPFARLKTGQLVDFFTGLRLGDLVDHTAKDDGWMTLTGYLADTTSWANVLQANMTRRMLEAGTTMPVMDEAPKCERCGQAKHSGHICRL